MHDDVRDALPLFASPSSPRRPRYRSLLLAVSLLFLSVAFLALGVPYILHPFSLKLEPPPPPPIASPLPPPPVNNVSSHDELPVHPGYVVFAPPPARPRPAITLRPGAHRVPDHCLEAHLALDYACVLGDGRPERLDVVWTWVNASEGRLQDAMAAAADVVDPEHRLPTIRPKTKLYRDHDELRHSVRSVLQHFRQYSRTFHVFGSDFAFAEANGTDAASNGTHLASSGTDGVPPRADLRLGQRPQWLAEPGSDYVWSDGDVRLRMVHQASVFQNYEGTSFNSFGIESQLPFLQGVSDNFLYLNDDFYFTRDLNPSDFYSPAFGMVLRFDPGLRVGPQRSTKNDDPAGEWGPLHFSSYLLSQRFGVRNRAYVLHAPKSLSLPLLQEAAVIWSADVARTASHRFRGAHADQVGEEERGAEAYVLFLSAHFVVERWREALLWSWIVARVGGPADEWGPEQKRAAWAALGGAEGFGWITVRATERASIQPAHVERKVQAGGGAPLSGRSTYAFSSWDGYPFDGAGYHEFPRSRAGRELCQLSYDDCIGGASSASEAFKTIAFDKPSACGDCIIHALRAASGPLGLSAFLPASSREFHKGALFDGEEDEEDELDPYAEDEDEDDGYDDDEPGATADSAAPSDVPHLPLVKDWRDGAFALADVLADSAAPTVNVRRWTLRLLARYRFVVAWTNSRFLMVTNPREAQRELAKVDKDADLALLCLNDDVSYRPEETDRVLRQWQDRRWPARAAWEVP